MHLGCATPLNTSGRRSVWALDYGAQMGVSDDRLDIIELIHRYAAVVDLDQFDQIPRVFAFDAVCDYGSMAEFLGDDTRPTGHADIERWMRRDTADRQSLHFMHNHVVDFVDSDHARMRNYLHNANSSITGIYETEARRTADGWRLSSLRLEERFVDRALVPPPSPHATGDA